MPLIGSERFTLYCFVPITAMPLSSTGSPSGTQHLDTAEERDHVDRCVVADDLRVAEIDLRAAEERDRVQVVVEPPRSSHLLAREHADRPPPRRITRRRRFHHRRQRRRHRDELFARLRGQHHLDARGEVVEREQTGPSVMSERRDRLLAFGVGHDVRASEVRAFDRHQYDRGKPRTCSAT